MGIDSPIGNRSRNPYGRDRGHSHHLWPAHDLPAIPAHFDKQDESKKACFTEGRTVDDWAPELMKDAADCDKLRGAVCGLRSEDLRMGKPGTGNAVSSGDEPERNRAN